MQTGRSIELPEEIWSREILRHVPQASTFVLRFVNRLFHRLLSNTVLYINPLIEFAHKGYINIIKWDQNSTWPSKVPAQVAKGALLSGNLELITFLFERFPAFFKYYQVWMRVAMMEVSVEIFKFMIETAQLASLKRSIEDFAINGRFDIVQYLMDECRVPPPPIESCLKSKNKAFFAYLLHNEAPFTEQSILALFGVSDSDFVEWVIATDPRFNPSRLSTVKFPHLFLRAAESQSLEVIKIARKFGAHLNDPWGTVHKNIYTYAVASGRILFLNWFVKEFNFVIDGEIYDYGWDMCAQKGALDMIELLFNKGVRLPPSLYNTAISSRQYELVSWLKSINIPIAKSQAFNAAVNTGWIEEAMELLNAMSTDELSSRCIESAVFSNNIPLMKLLIERKCPTTSYTMEVGLHSGNLEVIRLLHETVGLPFNASKAVTNILFLFDKSKIVHVLTYLIENGVTVESEDNWKSFVSRFHEYNKPILGFLVRSGLKLTTERAVEAMRSNELSLLKFIVNNMKEPLDFGKFDTTVRRIKEIEKSNESLRWLAEKFPDHF